MKSSKLLTINSICHLWYWWGWDCYSKIWYLGILNILSWRNFRSGRCRKDSLLVPYPLKQIIRPSCERYPPFSKEASLSLQTEGHQEESKRIGLCYVSLKLLHLALSFCPITFFQLSTLLSNLLWAFISLQRLKFHVKLVRFSSLSVFFVTKCEQRT